MTLLSAHQASKRLGVSSRTLRRWHIQGRIKAERTCGGVRLYHVSHILPTHTSNLTPTSTERSSKYIYARVSSPKQRSDLERQKEHLQQLYPSHLVLTDIASGINWKRPGLKTLLERSRRGLVSEVCFTLSVYFIAWRCSRSLYLGLETYLNGLFGVQVVVAHRDRLCRFAFDLIEHVLRLNNTKIIVVHSNDDSSSSTSAANELAQDILAINTVFICRMQGRRSAENRQRRKHQQQQQREEEGWREPEVCEEEKESGGFDEEPEDPHVS
jgi:putative resolvase